jgi:hypothetical protein
MTPVELRPVPPPNRQPLWLFWTRRFAGLTFTLTGLKVLRLAMWIYERIGRRPPWIFAIGARLIDFGVWTMPKARYQSMMRR